jgi:hypothetical protein
MPRFLSFLYLALSAAAIRADDADSFPVPQSRAEPAVVLSVRSVDAMLQDVDHLLDAGEVPRYSEIVRGFIANLNDLRGLDRGRPLGAMLFLDPADPDAEPQPAVLLPLTDIALVQEMVAATGNSLQPTEASDLFELRLGNDRMRLRTFDSYAVVTADGMESPEFAESRIHSLLSETLGSFDVAISVRRQGIPPAAFQRAVQSLHANAGRDDMRRTGEADREWEFRQSVQHSVRGLANDVLMQTEEIHAGWSISNDNPGASLSAKLSFAEGTLADLIEQSFDGLHRFNAGEASSCPLAVTASMQLNQRGRNLAVEALELIRIKVAGQLEKSLPEDEAATAMLAFDALRATLHNGRIEATAQFRRAEPERFVLVAGALVEEAEQFDRTARVLLPHAAEGEDVRNVTLDVANAAGLAVHRIRGMEVRPQDARLYGEDAAMHLAAGERAVWLAVGGPAAPEAMATAISASKQAQPSPGAAHLDLHVRPWAEWSAAHGGEKERRFAELVRSVFADRGDDRLQATLMAEDGGLRLNVQVDEGLLRVLARAIVSESRRK